MGLFSLKPISKERYHVVLDIGSATVGAAVVSSLSQSEPPRIHFTTRVPISLDEQFEYLRFVDATLKATRYVGEQVLQFLSKHPKFNSLDEVAVVLASPWYAEKAIHLERELEKETTITSHFIQTLLDEEDDTPNQEEERILKQRNILQPAIFERRILNISLNGYPSANPMGKDARRVAVDLFVAVMEQSFYTALHQLIEEQFANAEFVLHSHLLATFTTIRDCFGLQGDFLLVDVSGEVTDVALILNDVIVGTTTFPVGTYTIAQEVAQKKGTTVQEVLSLMSLQSQESEALHPDSKEHALLTEGKVRWKQEFERALQNLVHSATYPRDLFITASPSSSLWFKQILTNNEEGDEKNFVVTPLVDCLAENLVIMEKSVSLDTMLAIETLHVVRV